MSDNDSAQPPVERLSVTQAVEHVFEEARMLLPGAQTLFGFQLVVVFNSTFTGDLTRTEQYLHLAAMVLTAITIALLMAPAAYDRQVEPRRDTLRFLHLATHQLSIATVPLALALSLEIYLVAKVVIESTPVSAAIAGSLLVLYTTLWHLFPRVAARQMRDDGQREVSSAD